MSKPRMLLAVQPESGSTDRIQAAAAWAAKLGAVLDIATVVSPHVTLDPLLGADATRDDALGGMTIHRNASDWLEGLLPAIPEEQRGRAVVLTGRDAGEALVEASSEVDVLCVGTHHRTDFARLFLGSVAESIVRHAKCSVLVLGDSAPVPPRNGPLVVHAPIDVGQPNGQALNWLARHTDAQVTAIYIMPWVTVFGPTPGDGHTIYDNAMRALRNALAAVGHAETDGLVVVRPETSPGDALAHEASEAEAHLIAMPTHGRTGIARAIIGSVAERTVRSARTAVLVVR
ncbi:MAG: universal stress protein [Alphaproteobacteria bacterium]|nr:universal stress protein [Alphaproteobacteria bacterium]